jgi:hypothetical protein
MNLQYRRSFEQLERFACDETDPRLKAGGTTGSASEPGSRSGIWDETYLVRAGEYEAVYGNMSTHGLVKASQPVPIGADSLGATLTGEWRRAEWIRCHGVMCRTRSAQATRLPAYVMSAQHAFTR